MSEEKEIFDKKSARIFWHDELEGKKCIFADSSQSLVERVNTHRAVGIAFKPVAEDGCIDLCPFGAIIDGHKEVFTFCYYDPLYEIKWAWKQGKVIQVRSIKSTLPWLDWYGTTWMPDCYEYRVKPKPELKPTDDGICVYETVRVCGNCKYKDLPYSCTPCKECMEDDVDSGERSMWEPKELKVVHRMTNRELAKWVWQGNGQVKNRDGYYTLIACTAYDIREDNKPCPDYYVIRGWNETEWHEPEVEEE